MRLKGTNRISTERTIYVHIRRLRQSLDEYGRKDLVKTVYGYGYRFSLAA